jgi:hypothetical protein
MLKIGVELNSRWIYESALSVSKVQNYRHVLTTAERLFASIWSYGLEIQVYRRWTSALDLIFLTLSYKIWRQISCLSALNLDSNANSVS